jgi:RNA-directed DNA polymerase
LERLQQELKEDTYQPLPVRQHPIPKTDKPGEQRMLGIPAIYDRVPQSSTFRVDCLGPLHRTQGETL